MYVVLKTFKDIKKENGKLKFLQKGQLFSSEDKKFVAELLEKKMIVQKDKVDADALAAIEDQIAVKKQELANLTAKVHSLKPQEKLEASAQNSKHGNR